MENMTLNKRVMMAVRKTGHYLHHNAGPGSKWNEDTLFESLTTEEKESVIAILEKCLANWNETDQKQKQTEEGK